MGIALKQRVQGTSSPLVLPENVTAGNFLVFTASNAFETTALSGGGVTWKKAVISTPEPYNTIWYGENSSGGSKEITVTGSFGGGAATVSEWTGVALSEALDKTGRFEGAGTPLSTPFVAPENAGELIIGSMRSGNPYSTVKCPSYTSLFTSRLAEEKSDAEYLVYNGKSYVSVIWNGVVSSSVNSAVIALFKPAEVPGEELVSTPKLYSPLSKTPKSLYKTFTFATETSKQSIPLVSELDFKTEISTNLKVSQKLSSTILSKFESTTKLTVGYKLSSATIESKLSIVAPLKVEYKLGPTTLESKFSLSSPLKVQYKLPKTSIETKFSLLAPLKLSQKLSSTLESKFSLSAPLKILGFKLPITTIESKFSLVGPLKTKQKFELTTLGFGFSLSAPLLIERKQEVPNLPERISSPKIIIPGPAVKWNWWLCKSSNLGQIAELTSAHSKHLQLMLNQPGMASFWLHLEDERTKYIEELKTCIVCYRNGKAIFSGPVFKCVENADNTNNATLQVTALGWFELLNHRIVHTGKEWEEMLSKSGASYTPVATESALELYYSKIGEPTSPLGVPRNEIAVDLINRANIDVPTGITIGLNPEVSSLNFTVPQFHPVGELISQLTSIENGFDFKIDPLTRKFNIYYNQIKQNTTMYGLGQDRGQGVRFTYPGNCVLANRTADGTKTQNRTEAQGPYGVGKGESISSIAENGLFEKSESLTDVVNIYILIEYANIQTATLEQPFKILTFNPRSVNNSESYAVPRPFEDYDIGDIVYAKINKGPRFVVGYPKLQPVRIFGLNLDIDDNGIERVSQIQTVYSQ